jgi:membrane associated rhomboid family serine protease
VIARPIYRWSQDGGSFLRHLARDLRLGIAHVPFHTDSGIRALPLLTGFLIVVNTLAFLMVPLEERFFFADCEPRAWVWTNWTSQFLHADRVHLVSNMLFLCVFALPLEGRIGRGKMLMLYLASGTAANLISAAGNIHFTGNCTASLGASGAIAGLMGLYLVRCYFSKLSFGVPFLGSLGAPLPIVSRIRIGAPLLITLFFLLDLSGVRLVMNGTPVLIGYWAHVGGYLFGMTAAIWMGWHRTALREKLGSDACRVSTDGDFGRSRKARESLLEVEPEHIEARLTRARVGSRYAPREQAKTDYFGVIQLLLDSDPRQAAEIYVECFRKFGEALPLSAQLAITPHLVRLDEHDLAARSLELAAARPDVDSEARWKALLYEARLLREMGLGEAAEVRYRRLIAEAPGSDAARIARIKLGHLANC